MLIPKHLKNKEDYVVRAILSVRDCFPTDFRKILRSYIYILYIILNPCSPLQILSRCLTEMVHIQLCMFMHSINVRAWDLAWHDVLNMFRVHWSWHRPTPQSVTHLNKKRSNKVSKTLGQLPLWILNQMIKLKSLESLSALRFSHFQTQRTGLVLTGCSSNIGHGH